MERLKHIEKCNKCGHTLYQYKDKKEEFSYCPNPNCSEIKMEAAKLSREDIKSTLTSGLLKWHVVLPDKAIEDITSKLWKVIQTDIRIVRGDKE